MTEATAQEITNPRYIAYAKAHGETPEGRMETDKRRWPGGCMVGFMLWMSDMKAIFHKQHPEAFMGSSSLDALVDQEAWTAFLVKTAEESSMKGKRVRIAVGCLEGREGVIKYANADGTWAVEIDDRPMLLGTVRYTAEDLRVITT